MSKIVAMLTKILSVSIAFVIIIGDRIATTREEVRQQLHCSVEQALFEAKRMGVNRRTLRRIISDYYSKSGVLHDLYFFCVLKRLSYDRKLIRYNAQKRATEECTRLATQRVALDAKLVHVQMSFANRVAWERGVATICRGADLTRGLAVVGFAERWARLMELRMQEGEMLSAIVHETALEANVDHDMVFVFDFPVARRLLVDSWLYGRELDYAIDEQAV